MRKTTMAAGLALVAAFAGAGHAALVPIGQNLNLHLPPGLVSNVATDGSLSDSTVSHHELHVLHPGRGHPSRHQSLQHPGAPVDSWMVTDVPANTIIPFHDVVLGARQYVLQFTTRPHHDSIPPKVSAVPLPGAVWLFGAAILAFLRFSKRRTI
ncbi:MAG TPA: hypothetical protein VLK85_29635 [Ramlibacter sp.]|nr:hypothetical protein [Ramlibacter sp.]